MYLSAVYNGYIPNLLFDETDDGWYGVDAGENDADGGPVAYRVVEDPRKNTCEICAFIDGKTLPIELLEQGFTAPPFHPNCRGWVEVTDRDGKVLFVIGRDGGELIIYLMLIRKYKKVKAFIFQRKIHCILLNCRNNKLKDLTDKFML